MSGGSNTFSTSAVRVTAQAPAGRATGAGAVSLTADMPAPLLSDRAIDAFHFVQWEMHAMCRIPKLGTVARFLRKTPVSGAYRALLELKDAGLLDSKTISAIRKAERAPSSMNELRRSYLTKKQSRRSLRALAQSFNKDAA